MSTDEKIHIARMETIKTQARLKTLEEMIMESLPPGDREKWLAKLETESRIRQDKDLNFYMRQNPGVVH
jgi:hypothetical protein